VTGEAGLLVSPSRRPGEVLRRWLSRRPRPPCAIPARPYAAGSRAAPASCSLNTSAPAAVFRGIPAPVPLARHCAAVDPPVVSSIFHPMPPRRVPKPPAPVPLQHPAACRHPHWAPFQRLHASSPRPCAAGDPPVDASLFRPVLPWRDADGRAGRRRPPSCHPGESLPSPRRVLEVPASGRLGSCG